MFVRSLTAIALISLVVPAAMRAGSTEEATAKRFLEDDQRAKNITSFLHFGSAYKGSELRSSGPVTDRSGNVREGHFNLKYRYTWGDNDHTDVVFFFDDKARLYELQVKDSTAILNQPFLTANVSIKVLGAAIVAAFRDDLKEDDRKKLEQIIEKADAQELLTFTLKFQRNVLGK